MLWYIELQTIFRGTDLNLNNVWATGFEDSAELRTSDVKSPLPFTTHFHSTPNYWHENQDKQQNKHQNQQLNQSNQQLSQSNQQLNQSYIPNVSQSAKVDNSFEEREETGFELFSPLSAPTTGPRHRTSERNSISSYTSQSSQQSSDTDSFMELQGITDNMEKCNLFNNNYMYESQIANDMYSTAKSAFQPCVNQAKSSQSFSQNGMTSIQQNNMRKVDQGLSNFLAKRAMSFEAQKRQLIQQSSPRQDNSPRQNEVLQNSASAVNSKLANNMNMINSPKTPGFQNEPEVQQNLNMKSGFRPIVNPKTDFPGTSIGGNVENITNASFQNPPPVNMRPEMKAMVPVNSIQNVVPVNSIQNGVVPVNSVQNSVVQNGVTSNCVQNQMVSTPVSILTKPQELKPVNANMFQPVRVLTRPPTTSSMSTSDQGWSNPSTPGSVTDSIASHSDKTATEISATQTMNQKPPINFVPISVASKVAPPMYRHSYPLGIRPRFAPVQVDPHLVPVDPKFLLEPVQDKRYSVPSLMRPEQVMTEMMGPPYSLERNEEKHIAPVHTVPPPHQPQLVKYPAKIPLFVPASIPQMPLPGNLL